jgi:hypothetical protein
VPVNPMLRERELAHVLRGQRRSRHHQPGGSSTKTSPVMPSPAARSALRSPLRRSTTSTHRRRCSGDIGRRPQADAEDFRALVAAHAGQRPPDVRVSRTTSPRSSTRRERRGRPRAR